MFIAGIYQNYMKNLKSFNMNYTSIKQSKHLLKLGLNPESADMYWFRDNTEVPQVFPKDMMHNSVSVTYPCWSVGALIKLLPGDIYYNNVHCMNMLSANGVGYYSPYKPDEQRAASITWGENPDLVDALYNCIVWFLENKYIKN